MKKSNLINVLILMSPAAVWAHAGHETAAGFWAGIAHPFSGLDHLLAMIAVGIWAAQSGGRAIWVLPCSFVALMLAGGLLGMSGIAMPNVEQGIVASLLVLGLLIAFARRLHLFAGMTIVGAFALFHGVAHGIEMPVGSPALYMAGFAAATTLLHGLGLGAALLYRGLLIRLAGAAVSASGLYLLLA